MTRLRSQPPESTRKHARRPYEDALGIPVTIIQFGRLHRQDITLTGVDISEGGVGVSSSVPIAPGFVWFWHSVGDHQGGMIVWCMKNDNGYRAGIRFLPIPADPDDHLHGVF